MNEFVPFNRLKACKHGQMLYNINDKFVGKSLDLYGEYCEGEIEIFRQVIVPGSVVVEAGANIGALTVFLAKQAGMAGAVYAFEPHRVVFQTLCANVAINSLPNVHCYQQALSSQPGSLFVPTFDYTKENNYGGLSLGIYTEGETVEVTTIDSLELPMCHFIKIDVEGMEFEVLEGAVKLIERMKPILFVENDREDRNDKLIRFIDSLGYNMYWHFTSYFNPKNFFGKKENELGDFLSQNMLCVHKSSKHSLEGFRKVTVTPI